MADARPGVAGSARRLAAFLAIGLLGLVVMLLGTAWDARMHAADPTLAQREGVFAADNVSHVMAGVGIGLVAVGLIGAAVTVLLDRSVRLPRLGLLGVGGLLTLSFAAAAAAALSSSGDHQHGHDMSQFADVGAATPGERAEAQALLDRTRAIAPRFRTVSAARAAGYGWGLEDLDRPISKEPALLHGRSRAHYYDDRTLDPAHPESLVYWRTPGGDLKLVAFMYRMPAGEQPPSYGGPLIRWHGHDKCKDPRTRRTLGDPDRGRCPDGQVLKDNPEMTHVWLTGDLRTAFAVEAPADALAASLAAR